MIKKLQYKFIIINMSIVTVMLCIILGMVYYFTKMSMESDTIAMMVDIAEDPHQLNLPRNSSDNIRLPFFALLIGDNGELSATTGSYFDLSDEEFLIELLTEAENRPQNAGTIDEFFLRFYKAEIPDGRIIVFSDISSEYSMLKDLVRTCALIGILSFLVFLALSFFLAKWAIRPVDEAWKAQRQFIADASHELKTPLTVIITNAELLQSPEYQEADHTRFVNSILTMSKQMRNLVEQMLVLAKTDNVRQETVFSKVDLSSLITEAVLPFEPLFYEKGLILESEIENDIFINGDDAQLRQVIEILLDNAQKYSREKGTTWVKLQQKGKNRILLTVSNEGNEITAEDLNNLFKRFYRADKARSRTGSFGLGLSIAETIISQHKGKIWAESKAGINTFFVEFRNDFISN